MLISKDSCSTTSTHLARKPISFRMAERRSGHKYIRLNHKTGSITWKRMHVWCGIVLRETFSLLNVYIERGRLHTTHTHTNRYSSTINARATSHQPTDNSDVNRVSKTVLFLSHKSNLRHYQHLHLAYALPSDIYCIMCHSIWCCRSTLLQVFRTHRIRNIHTSLQPKHVQQ